MQTEHNDSIDTAPKRQKKFGDYDWKPIPEEGIAIECYSSSKKIHLSQTSDFEPAESNDGGFTYNHKIKSGYYAAKHGKKVVISPNGEPKERFVDRVAYDSDNKRFFQHILRIGKLPQI